MHVSEHLNLSPMGKAAYESHDRQPDSGNPTVRDEKGGLRNRASQGSRTEARWETHGIATGPYDGMRRISIPTRSVPMRTCRSLRRHC